MTISPYDAAKRHAAKWAYIRPTETMRLAFLRDVVWRAAGEPDGYSRSWPHITLHHHFSATPEAAREAQEALGRFRGHEIRLGQPYAFPSRENPRVVCCPVEGGLDKERDALGNAIDGTFHSDFVPPHLTLFRRTALEWDEPDIDAALRWAEGPFPASVEAGALVVARNR